MQSKHWSSTAYLLNKTGVLQTASSWFLGKQISRPLPLRPVQGYFAKWQRLNASNGRYWVEALRRSWLSGASPWLWVACHTEGTSPGIDGSGSEIQPQKQWDGTGAWAAVFSYER